LAGFQKLNDCARACIYANGAYFELKKGLCLPYVSLIFKISALKLLDHIVYMRHISMFFYTPCAAVHKKTFPNALTLVKKEYQHNATI